MLVRRPPQSEKSQYEAEARQVLAKQKERLVQICEAYVQAIGWIRPIDLTVLEVEVMDVAEKLIRESKRDNKVA